MSSQDLSYRASGAINVRTTLTLAILGAAVAAAVAGLVWLWEISPVPTLLLITPILQGLVVGGVLAVIVGRLKLRNPLVVGVVGLACGLLSIGLVHYGHYVRLISSIHGEILADAELPEPVRQAMLAEYDADPGAFVDQFLIPEVGQGGFVGVMLLRNREGEQIKNSTVSGTFLWFIWTAEALAVAGAAAGLAAARASTPFCEDCAEWCKEHKSVAVLPGDRTGPLVESIQADDVPGVTALRKAAVDPETPASVGLVAVNLHTCPACDLNYADVVLTVPTKKNEVKTTMLLKRVQVSPAMVAALRAPGPEAEAAPDGEGEAAPTADADQAAEPIELEGERA